MVCRILVADDSATIQKVIRIGLAAVPSDIKAAGSYVEALKVIEQGTLDLIIADAGLPGVSIAGDFKKLSERAGQIPIIILMGSYEAVRESDLRAVGLTHIIKKPFPPSELPQLVQNLTGFPQRVSTQAPKTAPTTTEQDQGFTVPILPIEGRAIGKEATVMRQSTSSAGLPLFPLGDDDAASGPPPTPEVEPARKGRPAFEAPSLDAVAGRSALPTTPQSPGMQPAASSVARAGQPQVPVMPNTNAGLSAAVEAFVRDELPALVDRAVERYCVENFKSVAREVLTAELRRLAEEKARYLVDQ